MSKVSNIDRSGLGSTGGGFVFGIDSAIGARGAAATDRLESHEAHCKQEVIREVIYLHKFM